jgi:hypothetical protein
VRNWWIEGKALRKESRHMVKRQITGWRFAVAIGVLAGIGALSPLTALAQQQPGPSGAAVEVGGVRLGAPGSLQQAPPVLPNTGGGPAVDAATPNAAEDSTLPALAALAGVVTIGTAAYYLRHRIQRRQVGG